MNEPLTEKAIQQWLREEDPSRLDALWHWADQVRRENVGDAVHLRGLIEISNYCSRQCGYCGLRAANTDLERYRMSSEEILECAHEAARYRYGTVVMQAGEDYGIEAEWLAEIVFRIKMETPLAVTLSMGERPDNDLRRWREAGADRYLLRFETSDPELFAAIHPPHPARPAQNRLEILRTLRRLGYEVGSGVMIGIPGQSYESLAHDIATFRELGLDMVGVGPYISHPSTPLGEGAAIQPLEPGQQVPNTELMTYKVVALTRLVCPRANIPSTTALATLNLASGRELGLQRGANVIMPNMTPPKYRALYQIYPAKACIQETSQECRICLQGRIQSIGRTVGSGPGGRTKT
ncbi:MAG: [FeFe] hydrogenase H-cluster radical SAM maturase HydE [Candidatus Hydrogenedentes bacterium]|nr:[FeFe] hydrogenase H-cluster radical SAM maturase HydE [Candidatus Hydrogenedentota bacterium]